jgi:hypothetical protein
MASISEEEEILEAAVAGIPRVAEVVASIPEEDRRRALYAAARSYWETVRNLGYEEGLIQSWVSAVMLRLQTEVKKQASTKQSPLKILQDELVKAATGLDNNFREPLARPGTQQKKAG